MAGGDDNGAAPAESPHSRGVRSFPWQRCPLGSVRIGGGKTLRDQDAWILVTVEITSQE